MNIILTTENEKITRATISKAMFISDLQSTEICKSDQEAAQGLLEYHEEGVYVAERDLAFAQAKK